jgi:hypothetical protein
VAELERRRERRLQDVGGTPGGLGSFLLGLAMLVLGAYLLLNQVVVTSHRWYPFGFNPFGYGGFGISLIPLLLGVALLFVNGRNPLAWLLTAAGALILFGGILASLEIFFRPTSLFNTLLMLVLLVGGLGLIARSLTRL